MWKNKTEQNSHKPMQSASHHHSPTRTASQIWIWLVNYLHLHLHLQHNHRRFSPCPKPMQCHDISTGTVHIQACISYRSNIRDLLTFKAFGTDVVLRRPVASLVCFHIRDEIRHGISDTPESIPTALPGVDPQHCL